MSIDKGSRRVRFSLGCDSCTSDRRSRYTGSSSDGETNKGFDTGSEVDPRRPIRHRAPITRTDHHVPPRRANGFLMSPPPSAITSDVTSSSSVDSRDTGHRRKSNQPTYTAVTPRPFQANDLQKQSRYDSCSPSTVTPDLTSLSSIDSVRGVGYSQHPQPTKYTQRADPYKLMPMVYVAAIRSPRDSLTSSVSASSAAFGPVIIQPHEVDSYRSHLKLAVFVTLLCGCVFGLVAVLLAASAESKKIDQPQKARQLGRVSLALSVAGIVGGVVLAIGISVGITIKNSLDAPGHS